MKLPATNLLAALIAAAAMSAANAQTVYRCGNTYAQAPCPAAMTVEVSDERSPAQQADARRVADGERRLATEMRRERLADERSTRGASAASLSGHAPSKVAVGVAPHQHPHRKKTTFAKPLPTTDFVASEPRTRKRRSD